MPFTTVVLCKSDEGAVLGAQLPEIFTGHVASDVAHVVNGITGETLEAGKSSTCLPLQYSISIPVAMSVQVMMWWTAKRADNQSRIQRALRELLSGRIGGRPLRVFVNVVYGEPSPGESQISLREFLADSAVGLRAVPPLSVEGINTVGDIFAALRNEEAYRLRRIDKDSLELIGARLLHNGWQP